MTATDDFERPTRIGSYGLCDLDGLHLGPHLIDTGIVDNGGNRVLQECPGQCAKCRNCDDWKCMACVSREIHERCQEDCPFCCPRWVEVLAVADPSPWPAIVVTGVLCFVLGLLLGLAWLGG